MGEKRMENCFDVNDSYGDKILGNCNKEKESTASLLVCR